MKKMLFSVVAILVGFAAAAQNSEVDKLVEKYSGKDGVSVIKIEGDMLKALGGMSSIEMNGVDVSDVVKDVKTVTVITNEKGNEALSGDIRVIVDGKEYKPMMDVNSTGDKIKIVKADAKRGENGEMIITIGDGDGEEMLIRIEGDLDPEAMAKVVKIGK